MSRLRIRDHDGFSVVEVVVAASILFFVVTAVLGLVAASQGMTVAAKRRNVLTNAMAEHIDALRAVDYATIAPGTVPAVQDVAYQGYTVQFTHRVVYSDGEAGKYLKTIYVGASTTIAGMTYSSTAVVHIKNPNNDAPAGGLIDPDNPYIDLVSPTPPSDAVLRDNVVNDTSHSIKLKTVAHSPSDNIVRVEYRVSGVTIRDDLGIAGNDAVFIAPTDFTAAPNIGTDTGWQTRQPGVADGFQTVSITAWDDTGRYSTESRRYIIDNQAPGKPGDPIGNAVNDVQATLQFTTAPDPVGQTATWASRYSYVLLQDTETSPYTGGATSEPPSTWTRRASTTVDSVPDALPAVKISKAGTITVEGIGTDPFSRYWASVSAGSFTQFNTTDLGLMRTPFVTRPSIAPISESTPSSSTTDWRRLSATRFTYYYLTLYVTSPTFPVSSTGTTYFLKTKEAVTGATWVDSTFTFMASPQTVGAYTKLYLRVNEGGDAKRKYFKLGVRVTPTGWPGNNAPTPIMWANAVGVTDIDTDPTAVGRSAVMYPQGWSE